MRSRPTVLFICHNHPSVRPGGAEAYALELHRHLVASGELRSVFLAKGGPPLSAAGSVHLGTYVAPVDDRPDEYFFFTEGWSYDWTLGTIRDDKRLYTKHVRAFLRAIQPDVVHFQHTMFFGYDILREVKRTLPERGDRLHAARVHADLPPPGADAAHDRRHALHAGVAAALQRVLPGDRPQTFFLRKRFVQSHLSVVDRFIAPSAFLAQRYVDWGLPAEKVQVEEYGRTPPPGEAPSPAARAPRPLRLLRPADAVQGSERGAGGDPRAARRLGRAAGPAAGGARTRRRAAAGRRRAAERRGRRAATARARPRRQPRPPARPVPEPRRRAARARRRPRRRSSARYDHDELPRLHGRGRLGRRPVDLVGELAARDPGGVPLRAARDRQRHRRDGREGDATRSTACTSAPATRRASPRRCGGRRPSRACGTACAAGSDRSTAWTGTRRRLSEIYEELLHDRTAAHVG